MRAVVQRVASASVSIKGVVSGAIGRGLLVLLGVETGDSAEDIIWLVEKITKARIFDDAEGKMNRSVCDAGGEGLVVSQFTLFGTLRKGTRPSFHRAAPPSEAERLYGEFNATFSTALGKPVPTGVFGAMMEVSLLNDGPVTLVFDSHRRDF
ncbi:MAG: D-tyrosyl-tRNA(Tyr) deacylase [Puniceicoccales bacterium]|jgi:D-tyrosyl-tRNA(Tyr) deacylase|nr:D-tyrosyl-tRNA(Tyr) deacylase [Puniceicoccales bacterium]